MPALLAVLATPAAAQVATDAVDETADGVITTSVLDAAATHLLPVPKGRFRIYPQAGTGSSAWYLYFTDASGDYISPRNETALYVTNHIMAQADFAYDGQTFSYLDHDGLQTRAVGPGLQFKVVSSIAGTFRITGRDSDGFAGWRNEAFNWGSLGWAGTGVGPVDWMESVFPGVNEGFVGGWRPAWVDLSLGAGSYWNRYVEPGTALRIESVAGFRQALDPQCEIRLYDTDASGLGSQKIRALWRQNSGGGWRLFVYNVPPGDSGTVSETDCGDCATVEFAIRDGYLYTNHRRWSLELQNHRFYFRFMPARNDSVFRVIGGVPAAPVASVPSLESVAVAAAAGFKVWAIGGASGAFVSVSAALSLAVLQVAEDPAWEAMAPPEDWETNEDPEALVGGLNRLLSASAEILWSRGAAKITGTVHAKPGAIVRAGGVTSALVSTAEEHVYEFEFIAELLRLPDPPVVELLYNGAVVDVMEISHPAETLKRTVDNQSMLDGNLGAPAVEVSSFLNTFNGGGEFRVDYQMDGLPSVAGVDVELRYVAGGTGIAPERFEFGPGEPLADRPGWYRVVMDGRTFRDAEVQARIVYDSHRRFGSHWSGSVREAVDWGRTVNDVPGSQMHPNSALQMGYSFATWRVRQLPDYYVEVHVKWDANAYTNAGLTPDDLVAPLGAIGSRFVSNNETLELVMPRNGDRVNIRWRAVKKTPDPEFDNFLYERGPWFYYLGTDDTAQGAFMPTEEFAFSGQYGTDEMGQLLTISHDGNVYLKSLQQSAAESLRALQLQTNRQATLETIERYNMDSLLSIANSLENLRQDMKTKADPDANTDSDGDGVYDREDDYPDDPERSRWNMNEDAALKDPTTVGDGLDLQRERKLWGLVNELTGGALGDYGGEGGPWADLTPEPLAWSFTFGAPGGGLMGTTGIPQVHWHFRTELDQSSEAYEDLNAMRLLARMAVLVFMMFGLAGRITEMLRQY